MTQTQYKDIIKNQSAILKELAGLRVKIAALGSLERFEALAKRGRKFAKKAGIKPADVLRGD